MPIESIDPVEAAKYDEIVYEACKNKNILMDWFRVSSRNIAGLVAAPIKINTKLLIQGIPTKSLSPDSELDGSPSYTKLMKTQKSEELT